MAQPKKHSPELINRAHTLAFEGELTNAQIAKKLKLTDNQLAYIIYQCKPTDFPFPAVKSFHVNKAEPKVEPKEEKTMLAKAFDWLLGT